MPHEEQYTPRFHFDAGMPAGGAALEERHRPTGKLISWVGHARSIVGNAIAPPFAMPGHDDSHGAPRNVLRLFHTPHKRNARKPIAEPPEVRAESLTAIRRKHLPARPMPPNIEPVDVPKITQ